MTSHQLTSMKLVQMIPPSDEFEVNEVSRGKKWSNNNYRKNGYSNN